MEGEMVPDRTSTPRSAEAPWPPAAAGAPPPRLPIWRFFLISHGFSWACWIAAALWAGANVWETPARWLVYLGGLGPLLAGVVMVRATAGGAGLRELGSRIVDPRRIRARWMAVALLLPALAMAGAVAIVALAGALPGAVDASRLLALIVSPAGLLAFALFVLVFGPIPEEIGWRGYALDALQARWSALAASLLLGAAWALWHAPLFFITGYYADGAPPEPVHFTVAILVHSVLYTWIHNHTGRSVLAAILFHFSINFGPRCEVTPLVLDPLPCRPQRERALHLLVRTWEWQRPSPDVGGGPRAEHGDRAEEQANHPRRLPRGPSPLRDRLQVKLPLLTRYSPVPVTVPAAGWAEIRNAPVTSTPSRRARRCGNAGANSTSTSCPPSRRDMRRISRNRRWPPVRNGRRGPRPEETPGPPRRRPRGRRPPLRVGFQVTMKGSAE
jgi:uncharacterized protein